MEGCREFRGMAPPLTQGPLLPTTPNRRQRGRLRNGGGGGGSVMGPWWKAWLRKYVVACMVCGGLSVSHGVIFIVIYLLLRSYTSSLQFFETIPTYVPGVVFIITGLILMCFAKRRNRYAFLLKMAGGCCLVCALLCVVITVTTTVVHMNRLQTLHECVYTPQAKTCMCVSAIGDHNVQEAHRFVFNGTPNCEVVHGSLYSCLRALFSFSVLGILLCISCSMLVYQLLSHEKKRLYWEQLELRRRFLYQRHNHHGVCGCYDELYPWQLWEMLDYRFHLTTSNHHHLDQQQREERAPPHLLEEEEQRRNNRRRRPWHWLLPPWRHNHHHCTSNSTITTSEQSPQEDQHQLDPDSLQWRSECIHIFRPSRGPPPATRFGPPLGGQNHHGGHHRRTRSNDAVFHHLHHMGPRYAAPPPFSLVEPHYEIPRYLWGPPPPYSQPQVEGALPRVEPLEGEGAKTESSSPISERRRYVCDFSSEGGGITLTINGAVPGVDYGGLLPPDDPPKKDETTCIVEVHVPSYLFHHPRAFHTLPARSHRRGARFKSLSSLPKAPDELGSISSFPPTLVEAPSEFKSSLVIAASTPLGGGEGAVPPPLLLGAQSMPNLTLSRSSASPLRRAPSSGGDTSTSQDMADFELEDDSAPALFSPKDCDPFSDDDDSTTTGDPDSGSSCGGRFAGDSAARGDGAAPSIIISRRPPTTDCPIDCGIRHLHRYHPDKREAGFVVTIKSLNV